jgi:hypothetical protein
MTVLDVMAHELFLQLDARHISVSIETCKDMIEAVVSTTAALGEASERHAREREPA